MNRKIIYILTVLTISSIFLFGCTVNININDEGTKDHKDAGDPSDAQDLDVSASFENTTDIRIGTTGYIITVPSDYFGADITQEDRRDDMIAYYKSEEHLMDFDIYQFERDGKTLEEYTAEESEEYGAEDFETVKINDIDLTLYYSEERYDDISYSVANYIFAAGDDFGELSFWLDGDDAKALTEGIISSLRYDGEFYIYDMVGEIVDKLPESEYYNHYNVKGDNDEIYICNYNGEDELEAGTRVNMFRIEDGWTIEVADDTEEETLDESIIMDENGVMVTDMEIMINTPETCYFDFTLKNPAGTDLTFDQTKITLENYDGTELKPFADDSEPLDASAYVNRVSYTMDIGKLKNGDEVSVYYDGKYVTSIIVGGGPKTIN
jgi:hypothetical protein